MTFKTATFIRGRWLTAVLASAACIGIATLLAFGYRATLEWQRSANLLVSRGIEEELISSSPPSFAIWEVSNRVYSGQP